MKQHEKRTIFKLVSQNTSIEGRYTKSIIRGDVSYTAAVIDLLKFLATDWAKYSPTVIGELHVEVRGQTKTTLV